VQRPTAVLGRRVVILSIPPTFLPLLLRAGMVLRVNRSSPLAAAALALFRNRIGAASAALAPAPAPAPADCLPIAAAAAAAAAAAVGPAAGGFEDAPLAGVKPRGCRGGRRRGVQDVAVQVAFEKTKA
jgi:hypothetical protein